MDPNIPAPDSIDQAPTGIDPQQLLRMLAAPVNNIASHTSNILNQGDLLPSQMSINPGAEGFNLAAGSMFPGAPAGSFAVGGMYPGWKNLPESTREALKSLGNKQAVSGDEVEAMLKRLGIEYHTSLHPREGDPTQQTKYFRMKDSLSNKIATYDASVRVPATEGEAAGHFGIPKSQNEVMRLYDTGHEPPSKLGPITNKSSIARYPGVLFNQAGDPYSDPRVLWGALRNRFPGAKHPGGNFLTPEEFEPMRPEKGVPTPPNFKPDPNQMSFMDQLLKSLKDGP
jgi:hypothetical protein